jgi:hypothetical protein
MLSIAALLVVGVVIVAGIIGLVSWIGKRPAQDGGDDLDALGRSLLRKVREERDALAKVAATAPDSMLAAEAVAEANSLYEQSARAAEKRVELRALARAKAKSDFDIASLESRLALAKDAEKATLEQALTSKRGESAQYGKAELAIAAIEAKMHQAAAAISEVRAQLAVGQGAVDRATFESDELGGLVARLRTMSQSYQEAEEYLNQQ